MAILLLQDNADARIAGNEALRDGHVQGALQDGELVLDMPRAKRAAVGERRAADSSATQACTCAAVSSARPRAPSAGRSGYRPAERVRQRVGRAPADEVDDIAKRRRPVAGSGRTLAGQHALAGVTLAQFSRSKRRPSAWSSRCAGSGYVCGWLGRRPAQSRRRRLRTCPPASVPECSPGAPLA